MNSRNGLIIVIVLLLLALAGVGYWAYKSNSDKKALAAENETYKAQVGDLGALRDNLQREVDSLQQAYASLAQENTNLAGAAAAAEKRVKEKEAVIKKIKTQGDSESKNLNKQIQDLLKVKADLETSIGSLQAENDSLRIVTGKLTADLGAARSENDQLSSLNKTIQNELKNLTLANFKASGFRVEVEKKSAKATARAGRAKRLVTSFDLTGVKQEYQGLRPVYLVITDDKGTPIKLKNPIPASVSVNGQNMDIQAAQQKDINIVENQRLSFTHELDEKLKSGYYRVAVYTDIGMLGAASFRLQ